MLSAWSPAPRWPAAPPISCVCTWLSRSPKAHNRSGGRRRGRSDSPQLPMNSETQAEMARFLHRPANPGRDGFVLTHGAGGNANSGLLIALGNALSGAGFTVVRYNLPFRQQRPFG